MRKLKKLGLNVVRRSHSPVRRVSSEYIKLYMNYNREYWITQLKIEVGLPEVDYEDLVNYEVNMDSILGSGSTINAKDYVDNSLRDIEEAIKESEDSNKSLMESIVLPSFEDLNKPVTQIEIKPMAETDPEKYRYFSMGNNIFVSIYDNEDEISQQQITDMLTDVHFVGEIPREDLSGLEIIVSYYQYMNHVQEQQRLSPVDSFMKRMNVNFDGVKLEGFSEEKSNPAPFNFYLLQIEDRRMLVTVPNNNAEINHHLITNHWSFVQQVDANVIIPNVEVISYYKFVNDIAGTPNPNRKSFDYFQDSKHLSGFEEFDFSILHD